MRNLCVITVLLLAVVKAALPADEVTSLPGWNGPLPSKQYSGYLNITGGKHLHYWLVLSENNPTTDPLALWFNGGPGCSSLEGFLEELGPLHILEPVPATGTPLLYKNPYSWTRIANVMFIEAPACVGFSYADSPTGCHNSDSQQAIDNFNALQNFYVAYPEFAKNDLYISGESYAGIYVPTLAAQVVNYNAQSSTKIPLKGILVGNGVTDAFNEATSESYEVDFLYGHALFSALVYTKIQQDCGNFSKINAACAADLVQMSVEVGNVNIYDIYDVCINQQIGNQEKIWRAPPSEWQRKSGGVGGPDACIDSHALDVYLNQADVRTALHVKSQAQIGTWVECGGNLTYAQQNDPMLPVYTKTLIPNIRVLIYNGDCDACVPYNNNEAFVNELAATFPQTKAWTPWNVDSQVAGYLTNYQSNLQFITVKGAGHMVPQYKPEQALAMFQRFVSNTCC